MSELLVKRTLIGFVLKIVGLVVVAWGIIQGFIFIISFGDSFSERNRDIWFSEYHFYIFYLRNPNYRLRGSHRFIAKDP